MTFRNDAAIAALGAVAMNIEAVCPSVWKRVGREGRMDGHRIRQPMKPDALSKGRMVRQVVATVMACRQSAAALLVVSVGIRDLSCVGKMARQPVCRVVQILCGQLGIDTRNVAAA